MEKTRLPTDILTYKHTDSTFRLKAEVQQKGPRTSDQLLFKKMPFLVMYNLTNFDDVI